MACATGGAGLPSYTAGLRAPAASTAPTRHTAALTTLTRRRRAAAASRARWACPPSRGPVLRTTPAVALSGSSRPRSLDRGRRPVHDAGCRASRPCGEGGPGGAAPRHGDRWPDYTALVSPRPWSAYCQPICNEPASSLPSTAKRSATNRSFHCHGACNVTGAVRIARGRRRVELRELGRERLEQAAPHLRLPRAAVLVDRRPGSHRSPGLP
jgi:hypothetical protein